jgi:hypothetical protein
MTRVIVLTLLVACVPPGASGLRQNRYDDGKLQEEYTLRNGARHGKARTWHRTGRTESEGNYVADKREGRFVYYNDRGEFEYQVLYMRDAEVWRSTDPNAKPDVRGTTTARQEQIKATPIPETAKPIPWFASLDRTTSLTRVGAQLGVGAPAGLDFGSAKRIEAFANFVVGEWGAYGQFSQTSLQAMSVSFPDERTLAGRQTFELGATHALPLDRWGTTTARLGVLLPVGNDSSDGFVAGTAGAFQRPADAAGSVPSTTAVRTSTSLTRTMNRFVLQADAGFDWLLGGEPTALDVLARANLGVGFGSRTAIVAVELSNTMALTDLDRRLHAAGLSGGAHVAGFWFSGLLSYCINGGAAFTAGVGHEL